jgi:methionyl aminopeptidase
VELSGDSVGIRSDAEVKLMRRAGQIVCEILDTLEEKTKPGVTTGELDAIAEKLIAKNKAKPAFKGYHGFPAVLCASINQEVVHGIPSKKRTLEEGDLLKLDFGVSYQGWFGDSARTVAVGKVSEAAAKLLAVTQQALNHAIKVCLEGRQLGDIGAAVQSHAELHGFNVVRDFTGHGIGRALHERPQVPNYGHAGTGLKLKRGMTIAIEPMVNLGTEKNRDPRRRLDRGHARRPALRALRAHRADHRRRPRDPHEALITCL